MKFSIARTSSSYDTKPCKEARLEDYIRVDERCVSDPTMIPANRDQDPKWWYSEGTNHRVEKGHIMRDFDDKRWIIEINTLEELMKFYKKYGSLVIRPDWGNYALPAIEIYDGYRE